MEFLKSQLSERLKMTAMMNIFALAKLPLLAFITPEILEFSDERVIVKIRLGYRTRNHLKVMYFGALTMGAELSIAAACVDAVQKSSQKIDFLFKDFECKFLKRADGHVHFIFDDPKAVRALVAKSEQSPDRCEETLEGHACVEGKGEPVMSYKLTLTLKNRSLAPSKNRAK